MAVSPYHYPPGPATRASAEGASGLEVDFATLHKIYGAAPEADQRRYSPARCTGSDMKTVIGNPDPAHAHAVALHPLCYNFARTHRSLRGTPAMEARIADHVWTLEEMAGPADVPDVKRAVA